MGTSGNVVNAGLRPRFSEVLCNANNRFVSTDARFVGGYRGARAKLVVANCDRNQWFCNFYCCYRCGCCLGAGWYQGFQVGASIVLVEPKKVGLIILLALAAAAWIIFTGH